MPLADPSADLLPTNHLNLHVRGCNAAYAKQAVRDKLIEHKQYLC